MTLRTLYEQAVQLTPRAARIAALLLVDNEHLPAPLRRSLCRALAAPAAPEDEVPESWTHEGVDAAAAQRFVAACVEVARRLPASHDGDP
jgi:hypothetical protein